MKFFALAVLALLAPRPGIQFDREGLRLGDVVVRGSVLELKELGPETLLASGSVLEPLAASVEVELAPDRVLTLEPGVRVTRTEGGYLLSTHADRKIRLADSRGPGAAVASPVSAVPTAEGWIVGDQKIAGSRLRASTAVQDEDANLERMKQSADKVRTGGVPKLSTRINRLFLGNPLDAANAVNSINIRLIPQVTPSGAP